ncbi:S8 family serine peptidase [Jatrophihabitans telluris]|uniref:S8 family serine peptidase n=1 Tax=Jatrophihabitans telluris TaxID=2038343 RepID=A0ABY4QZF9_9ACTN|nr:S8 family serine peptidase [Jatrophihabitans telluris]UQX88814.1 S8 family serine peptidase [Jatrophihabitans telluris]
MLAAAVASQVLIWTDVAASAAAGDPVDAVIQLRAQADLTPARGLARRERLQTVEKTLRSHAQRTQKELLAELQRAQKRGTVTSIQPLWITNAIAVRATPAELNAISARKDVASVRREFTVSAAASTTSAQAAGPTEPNVALVNAPAVWNLGYRGQSVVVANMDTGVDVSHPDLAASWRGGSNSWYDPNREHPSTPTDVNGHGTQTMGVMVGGSAGGSAIGIAPAAKWIAVKIFNDRGSATSTAIHLGFQWLLDPDGNPATADAPNVVDDSWTMSGGGCDLSFQPDLRSLRAAGILPVFAAGNDGPTAGTIFAPANNPEAFAVGGIDNNSALYPYSSRGPSPCTQSVAPKLAAPAVGIRTTDLAGGYASDTGTSVAAPAVAGALALLVGAFPNMSADRQEAALDNGAVDLAPTGVDADTGFGRLDALASFNWLASTPDFTVGAGPSQVSVLAGGTANYSVNITSFGGHTADVSLSLSGLSSAQASWAFNPGTVAGGAGTSQLQITTSTGIGLGDHPVTITGTDGTLTRSTTVTLTVTAPPDFSVAVTPTAATVAPGAATSFTLSSTALNGFAGTLTLSASGLPASVGTAVFSPSSMAVGATSQWQLTTAASAPGGIYPVTITATSGTLSHTAQLTVTVPAQDFSLTISPSSVRLARGQTVTFTVTATGLNGFTGSISLTGSGLPAGSSATLTPNPVQAGASASWRIRTSPSATRTSYTIKITGKAGALSHQATATLTLT